MSENNSSSDYIVIGRLGSRFGVQGWMHVQSFTASPADLFSHPVWQIHHRGQWRSTTIARYQPHGEGFIVKLSGCDTPEEARLYANNSIAILQNQLPSLPTGDYYWTDLIGLQVITTEGIELGIIDHLLETGSNDVIIIKGKRQHILPYTDDTVKSIDLQQKRMVVDWDINF